MGAKSETFSLKRQIFLPDFKKSRTPINVSSRVGGDWFVEKCCHIFLLVTLSGSKHNHSILDAGKKRKFSWEKMWKNVKSGLLDSMYAIAIGTN